VKRAPDGTVVAVPAGSGAEGWRPVQRVLLVDVRVHKDDVGKKDEVWETADGSETEDDCQFAVVALCSGESTAGRDNEIDMTSRMGK